MARAQHRLTADIVVAGGGMAGCCAAIAAARHGCRVVLLQDRSMLGGNASSEVRMHIVGADCHGNRKGWRESGLIEELRLEDAVRNPARCYPLWDLLLYEKVTAEPNIALLLDTDCVGVELSAGAPPTEPLPPTEELYEYRGAPGRIRAVRAVRELSEDEFYIEAALFLDCTGDGRLGAEAGADFRIGRESREMHGEAFGLETADRKTLGSSILFTSRRYEQPVPFTAPAWARRFTAEDLKVGRPIHSWEYGFWWSEWGGHLDTLKQHHTEVRQGLYAIALGIWDYIKNSGDHPDSANWALDWIAAIPGKRESRRFLGAHVLTQDDILQGRRFPDDVAYGGWQIDLHPPSGVDATDEPPCVQHWVPEPYGIPLRCLYSRNIENLLFAGRNVSATHVGFASTRVMATCAVMGQAAGTAAAYCIEQGLASPQAIVDSPKHTGALQQVLLRDEATLLGVPNQDAADLARTARARASSEAREHPAMNVVDGFTRDEIDSRTAELLVSHRWSSAEGAALPQWIELEWDEPVEIGEVHLTWDTGFERPLMLTPSDTVKYWGIRGAQPETARDYRVEVDGELVLEVSANYQRKRIHSLAPVKGRRLRITIVATNGAPEARLFQVRSYAATER